MLENKIMRALNNKTNKTPPVWLMRQAGRYLKEYRDVREKAGGFLDLCYNPELAKEVTLQPIRRFGFDAAILFADILLLPQALGRKLWFETGEGPRLNPIIGRKDIDNFKNIDVMNGSLENIYETVRMVRSELSEEKTLIGFAGAPWTVATYMIAGKGGDDQKAAKVYMTRNPQDFSMLIDKLTLATIEYLSEQIKAGADVVKIFDSWAGALGGTYFKNYVYEPIKKISQEIKKRHPEAKVIAFPRGCGANYKSFCDSKFVDCIALDSTVPPPWIKKEIQNIKAIQGNLDPIHLVTGGDEMLRQIDYITDNYRKGPYIFNLGHGITPDADPKNVEILLKRLSQ